MKTMNWWRRELGEFYQAEAMSDADNGHNGGMWRWIMYATATILVFGHFALERLCSTQAQVDHAGIPHGNLIFLVLNLCVCMGVFIWLTNACRH